MPKNRFLKPGDWGGENQGLGYDFREFAYD